MAARRVPPLEAALRQVVRDLDELGVPWALVGGLAVSARAEPRTTRDVDAAVGVRNDAEAESVVFSLQSLGYVTRAVLEHQSTGRLATVRFEPSGGRRPTVLVDVLFASSGIEPEVASCAERLAVLRGLDVPVASVGHLIALKVLARDDRQRPQDADDLRALLAESSSDDRRQARDALGLITARGFHRGRDLLSAFGTLLRDEGLDDGG
ncbi:MAG TPA: nucleotidyl transferase AbiEii/AbiGii toxin family protein [Polyangiaceae bacterium]|nr:nucleotidyl transferase AbiEii/AbiGii toxin family protein [Polyangiaceae bacterium]